MRNVFQTQIDACQRDKRRLIHLHTWIAEFTRSQYDALLASPDGSERRAQMQTLKTETDEALKQIDKLCGWAQARDR